MLIILTSHPIQYQIPLWQALALESTIPFEVCFLSDHGIQPSYDSEFEHTFAWDIPMLKDFPYRFLHTRHNPSSPSFLKTKLPRDFSLYLQKKKATHLWIHGWNTLAHWQAIHIAHRHHIKTWLSSETPHRPQQTQIKNILKKSILTPLFNKIDVFLAIGSANRAFYKSFSIPDSEIHGFPYAVDNLRFYKQATELRPHRTQIRKQWCISPDAYVLLFCGKFIPKKRPHDLIRAAALYAQEKLNPPLHLLFTGSGTLEEELKKSTSLAFDYRAASTHSTSFSPHLPKASFTGFLNQSTIAQAYVAADALVLPSDNRETWGLVVNEALACGCPAIISDQCGCAPDLSKIFPNLTYPSGDIEALTAAIHKLTGASYKPEEIFSTLNHSGHSIAHLLSQIDKIYHQPS